MRVEVVVDGPRGRSLRAAWRRAPTLAGALLVCLGAVAALAAMALTIAVAIYAAVWVDSRDDPDHAWPDWFEGYRGILVQAWLLALILTAVGALVGLRLVRENRNLILFLRRFGYRPATQTVTEATGRLGDFWRVVTLDDDDVESLGPGEGVEGLVAAVGTVKRSYRAAAPVVGRAWKVIMRLAAAGLALALILVLYPGPDWTARGDRLTALVELDRGPDDRAALGARIAALALAVGVALLAVWLVAMVAGWVLSIPVRLVYGGVARGVTAAADADELHIVEQQHIDVVRRIVEEQRQRVFGPRLTVLTVNSAVWRETVLGMADICAVPLIDVSEPTENVLWEVEELIGRFGDRCVFIGDHDRLQGLIAREPDAVTQRLAGLLDGRQVLAYTPGAKGTRRFVRALGSTLERHVRRPLVWTVR
jgi:hypothetical protein